jgi:hypothetical protein
MTDEHGTINVNTTEYKTHYPNTCHHQAIQAYNFTMHPPKRFYELLTWNERYFLLSIYYRISHQYEMINRANSKNLY